MPDKFKNFLFDLDGTIIEPKESITRSIQYAMRKLGYEPPSCDELEWCIGPPLYSSFHILLDTKDESLVLKAVDLYREIFVKEGILQNYLYDGIEQVLRKLYDLKINIFLATSKPRVYSETILKDFKISGFFKGIYGAELDGALSNKAELIAFLVKKERINSQDTLMIGDRKHDILGAKANNIKSCGVLYGYGSEEEFKESEADYIVKSPEDILIFA